MTNEITTNVEMTAECKNDLDWIIEECLDFADFGWMIANGQGIGTNDISSTMRFMPLNEKQSFRRYC